MHGSGGSARSTNQSQFAPPRDVDRYLAGLNERPDDFVFAFTVPLLTQPNTIAAADELW